MSGVLGRRTATKGRLAISFFVAVLIAAFITLGMSAPAQAASPGTLKVRIANKAGELLTGMSKHLAAVPVVNGVGDTADSAQEPVESPAGTYEFDDLAPGSYAIGFVGTTGTISELYSSSAVSGYDEVNFQQATLQSVVSGETSYLDFSVISSVGLKGTVTGPTNHAVGAINVEAYRFDGSNWIDWQAATTNAAGAYSFAGLDAGSYKLEFTDYTPTGYLDQFSGGGSTLAGASFVYIPVGGTATVNAKLATGGRLTGKATYDAAGIAPANLVLPFAYPVTVSGGTRTVDKSKWYFGAPTGSNGVWTVAGLPTGSYVVKLVDDAGAGPDSLVNAYVGPTGPVTNADDATVFNVTVGHTTTAPGSTLMALAPDVSTQPLTIQVYDPDGHKLQNASVSLTPASDNNNDYYFSSYPADGSSPTLTDENGQITAGRIPEGDYVLSVDYDVDGKPVYQPYITGIHYDGEGTIMAQMVALTSLGWSSVPYPGNLTTVGSTNTEFDTPNQDGTSETRQWERDGVPILGATSHSYTAAGGDIGKTLSVVVTLSKPGFPPVGYTAFVGVITVGSELVGWDAAPAITSSVASPVPGSTLYATSGTWMADSQPVTGVHATITWWGSTNFFASSTQIGTGATYVVQPTDAATEIRAEVVAQKPGYTNSVPSPTNIFDIGTLAAPTLKTAPKITATKLAGGATRYTTTAGAWSVSGLQFTYAWSLGNGAPTTTVPANTYTYLATDHPNDLYVNITAGKAGYLSKTISVRVSKGTTIPTTNPGNSGAVTDATRSVFIQLSTDPVIMGDTLSSDDYQPGWDYPGAPFPTFASTYQWYRQFGTKAPVAITHATASTYVTTVADVGAKLTLIASSASSDYPVGKSVIVAGTVTTNGGLVTAAPTVSITGPNSGAGYVPGSTLTGTVGSWGTTGVTQHAQWFVCHPSAGAPPFIPAQTCTDSLYYLELGGSQEYQAISKATSMSYLTSLSQAGAYLVLQVTGSKPGYQDFHAASAPLQLLDAATTTTTPFPFHGHVGITGAVQVGKALKATLATPDVAGATIQTQWRVCASECDDPNNFHLGSGAGANSTTYVPTVSDFGTGASELQFSETFTKTGYGVSGDSTDASIIVLGQSTVTKAFTVKVTTTTDTVVPGTWSPAGGMVTYQWSVNGVDEGSPSTSPTRLRKPTDTGLPITVVISDSPALAGYAAASTTLLVQRGQKPTTTPDPLNGNTYGAPLQLSNPNPFTYGGTASPVLTHQWYVSSYATKGAAAIKGATSATYSPPASYVGKYITEVTTARDPNWNDGSYSAQVKLLAAAPVTGTQQLTSNVSSIRPGATVTAATSYPAGTTFSYQWAFGAGSSTPVAIPGATHSTYVVLSTQAGGHLQVSIIAKSSGHNSSTPQVVSAPVEYSLPIVGLTSPTITGLGIVGSPLGVNVGLWNTTGLSFSYQWEVNGIPIPGATGATFTPLGSEWTDSVDVVLTAKKTGYVTVTVQTPNVQIGLGAHPVATTLPKITGTLTSGHTITVSTGTWNVDGLTFSYAWSFNGVPQSTLDPNFASSSVPNASAGTYQVVVTASRAGYVDGTATTLTVIVH